MKVHYLQTVDFEGPGAVKVWAEQNAHQLSRTGFHLGEPLPSLEEIDLLAIMGGPMGVYDEDQHPWIVDAIDFVAKFAATGKPTIGFCFGAQILACALGSRVYRNDHKEIGWFDVELTEDGIESGLFEAFGPKFSTFHWHGDAVEIPTGAKHLAYSEGCAPQAFLHGSNALGIQFHPEMTCEVATALADNCAAELVEARYIQSRQEMLSAPERFGQMNEKFIRLMERFLAL